MFGLGIWETILVLVLIFFFFGGKKIPMLARGLGSAIRNFKGEMKKPEDGGHEKLPGDDEGRGR